MSRAACGLLALIFVLAFKHLFLVSSLGVLAFFLLLFELFRGFIEKAVSATRHSLFLSFIGFRWAFVGFDSRRFYDRPVSFLSMPRQQTKREQISEARVKSILVRL